MNARDDTMNRYLSMDIQVAAEQRGLRRYENEKRISIGIDRNTKTFLIASIRYESI
jgi:hypothetical protein